MSLLQNSNAISAGGYDINSSLRFRTAATSYLLRTPTSTTNRQTWTWSGWVKRGVIGVRQHIFVSANPVVNTVSQQEFQICFDSSDKIEVGGGVSGVGNDLTLNTTQVFRDPSAWYHLVVAVDTTQATSTNRVKLYVNGSQVTVFGTATYPAQNHNTAVNLINFSHRIGGSGGSYLDGYQAEVNLIDGQALTPSSFGETDAVTGSWVAKKYTGTYGTNGFYLKFANDSNSLSQQYGALLNGSSQFVSLTPTSAFNFSNNNWTIETFIWPNGTTNQCVFSYGYEGSTNRCMVIYYTAGNLNLAYSTNGSNNTDTSFGAHNMPMNQWHHLAIVRNGTTITAYINGVPLPTTITIGTSSINYPGTSGAFRIGRDSTSYLSAFLHGFRIINGTAAYTSKFKPTTSKLTAITNTQLLTLQDATLIDSSTNNFTLTNNGSFSISYGVVPYAAPSIGADYSGNINNWLIGTGWNVNDISDRSYCVMYDSPTLTSPTVGNYCTLNPLPYYGTYPVMSQGNLQFTSGNANWMRGLATFAVSSGKWYWEVTMNNIYSQMHGIVTATTPSYYATATNWVGYDATGYGYFSDTGGKWNNNTGVAYGSVFTSGDIIGIAFDADNGKLYFSKNGTFQASGDPAAGTNAAFTGLTNGPYVPAVSVATTSGANTCDANFGQRPFSYTPPTGFKLLNTYNLPTPTILKGNVYMDATTYSGSVATTLSVTNNASFQTDLVWIKNRTTTYSNSLFDSVRGTNRNLYSNSTSAEVLVDPDGWVSAFNSNGFTVTNGGTSGGNVKANSSNYVGWQWKAGNIATNTSGSITSTISANTTAGFSIVTWTGSGSNSDQTVGTGLSTALDFIITKARDTGGGTDQWLVYTSAVTLNQNECFLLNSTAAKTTGAVSGTPTRASTAGQLKLWAGTGNNQNLNASGIKYVAYCFTSVLGYSKFGSYTGNGVADGPFVYTGFRPKFVMIKSSTGVEQWDIHDTSRDTYNAAQYWLSPSGSNAEGTINPTLDILSNGFKIRYSTGPWNTSGGTYIYMAFAENPFKNANAR